MDNLHQQLAPISAGAWAQIQEQAATVFRDRIATRRVLDVTGPAGPDLAAIDTGHLTSRTAPVDGVTSWQRTAVPLIQLRVPFVVTRETVDDVERGATDSDWQSVEVAAAKLAEAEDKIAFTGWSAGGVAGLIEATPNPSIAAPAQVGDYPIAVAQAASALRQAGVQGPYALLLPAAKFTEVVETTDHGYPIRDHIARILTDGQILWAPALSQAVLVSIRGGDYTLHLGEDTSIGYGTHTTDSIELYLQESFAIVISTAEACVVID